MLNYDRAVAQPPALGRDDRVGPANRDRHNRPSCVDGRTERPETKRQQPFTAAPSSLRIYEQRTAGPQPIHHRSGAREPRRTRAAIDREMSRLADAGPDERPRQHAVLGHEPKVHRDDRRQDDRVDVADVIGDEHHGAGAAQMLGTGRPHAAAAGADDETRPSSHDPMSRATTRRQQNHHPRGRHRDDQQHGDVRGEQRVADFTHDRRDRAAARAARSAPA